jgi:hypothetical protein
LSKLDPDTLWDKLSPQTHARLWVCEHFRVLPTEDRYKKLTDLQAGLLFSNWLNSVPDDTLRREYWSSISKKPKAPSREELAAIGYKPEQIDQIIKEISG